MAASFIAPWELYATAVPAPRMACQVTLEQSFGGVSTELWASA